MAGLDNIKDIVLTYADEYAKGLSAAARSTFTRGTGTLANSYRGVAKLEQNKFIIEVYGEDYGIYQDSGVFGTSNKVARNAESLNPPGQFKTQFKAIGGDLPLLARIAIHRDGLKPKPFMRNAIDMVNTKFIADLEDAGVKDVEQYFETLTKIEVK